MLLGQTGEGRKRGQRTIDVQSSKNKLTKHFIHEHSLAHEAICKPSLPFGGLISGTLLTKYLSCVHTRAKHD